ncbi:MAG: Type 1 glutamine amidotransferase-like domain-containing protein [Candidatus Limnocylindrales bacterium]
MGTLALHGGGEFEPGDERFLAALVEAARGRVERRADGRPIQAVVVPTAAARGRPDLAGARGVSALEPVAASLGVELVASVVPVLDAESAVDPTLAARLAAADLIYLPGGDPDLIPGTLAGSAAWAAVAGALADGAVVAGASAGAMGLAELTWTPAGIVPGLGAVAGLLVVPHADAGSWANNLRRFGGRGASTTSPVGLLGLGERTGVIGPGDGTWRVVGEGEVRWLRAVAGTADLDPDGATVLRDGDRLDTR